MAHMVIAGVSIPLGLVSPWNPESLGLWVVPKIRVSYGLIFVPLNSRCRSIIHNEKGPITVRTTFIAYMKACSAWEKDS